MSRIALAALMLTLFRVGLLPSTYGQRYPPCSIRSGSTVFIPTEDEFGKELKKALLEAGIELVFVSDMGNADFEIVGKVEDSERLKSNESPRVEGARIEGPAGSTPHTFVVSVNILNLRTKDIAWGYGVTGVSDTQDAAQSFVSHLKEQMKAKHS
jgi:hypothetical protein